MSFCLDWLTLSVFTGLFFLSLKSKGEMKLDNDGFELIKSFEGFDPIARWDGSRWTLGHGNTYFENRQKVKRGDQITRWRAKQLFEYVAQNDFANYVNRNVSSSITQTQFNALVSFAYNVGNGNFGSSTLLKKVNANPNDPTISYEFNRWNKSGGKILVGLTTRRAKEAQYYFYNVTEVNNSVSTNNSLWALILVLVVALWYTNKNKKFLKL
jgi:lysozyme